MKDKILQPFIYKKGSFKKKLPVSYFLYVKDGVATAALVAAAAKLYAACDDGGGNIACGGGACNRDAVALLNIKQRLLVPVKETLLLLMVWRGQFARLPPVIKLQKEFLDVSFDFVSKKDDYLT